MTMATADFVSRADGILAGTASVRREVFAQVDPTVVCTWAAEDGDPIHAHQVLGAVSGPLAAR